MLHSQKPFCLVSSGDIQLVHRYMYELGRAVPIIPVITKADTMTIREAQTYKQEVYNRLQNPNLKGVWLVGPTYHAPSQQNSCCRPFCCVSAAPDVIPLANALVIDVTDLHVVVHSSRHGCCPLAGIHSRINVFSFDKDTLERAGIAEASSSNTPPFLVIASNDINEEMGGLDVPVRGGL